MTRTVYEAWLEEQTIWLNELEKAYWKICLQYIVMVLFGCTVALFALGCFVGGIPIGMQNAFFGLVLGLFISLFCLVAFRAQAPRKCYLKSLKREMGKELPEEYQQEKFARQMLESTGNKNIRKISWKQSGGKKQGRLIVTKEFAVRFSDNSVTVVRLGQVKRMELDAHVDDISVRGEYGTTHRRQENFIIRFYYRSDEAAPSSSKKEYSDKRFNLPSRELRDNVARAIEEMQEL